MGKRKDIEAKPMATSEGPAPAEPKPFEPVPVEPAAVEAPKIEMSAPKIELPMIESPKLGDAYDAPIEEAARQKDAPIPPIAAQEPSATRPTFARINKFALLAASVAIAAALGAIVGALGANGFGRSSAPVADVAPVSAVADATRALQGSIAQLRTDLAALKTSVEAGPKNTNGQFAKIAERFDRIERAQSEPKIGKVVEALDRLEKRVESLAAKDTTGSVATAQPAVATTPAPSAQPPVVDGWVVRDVYHGAAIIQGRRFGMLEVEAGDVVPGIGRVEAIKKQDGRWIVVTSKGVIASPR